MWQIVQGCYKAVSSTSLTDPKTFRNYSQVYIVDFLSCGFQAREAINGKSIPECCAKELTSAIVPFVALKEVAHEIVCLSHWGLNFIMPFVCDAFQLGDVLQVHVIALVTMIFSV